MDDRITALFLTISTADTRNWYVSAVQAINGMVERGTEETYHSLSEEEARQLLEDLVAARWPGYVQPLPNQAHFDLWP